MKINTELIETSEYHDTYRITNGVIVYVYKYTRIGHIGYGYRASKDGFERIRGISRCFKTLKPLKGYLYSLKKDFTGTDVIFEAGTILIDGYVIKKIENPKDYVFEVALSGGSETCSGTNQMLLFLNAVEEVIKKYEQ